MKRNTRVIFLIALLVAIGLGWRWLTNSLGDKMYETLSARYPVDSFTLDDVKLSVLPLGATAQAHAEFEDLDFSVSFVKVLGDEDKVVDNLYEARSRKHYEDLFSERMEVFGDLVESYYLEMIVIGMGSLEEDSGLYPAALHVLLASDIRDTDRFVEAVEDIATAFEKTPVEGVDAYHFISFPGSVPESDLPSIGLQAAWLTNPTPTPIPTPTPRPIVTGTSAPGTTTKPTTKATTTASGPTKPEARPAFAYEITLLTDRFDTNTDRIRNGIRTVTYSTKDLQKLAESFHLDNTSKNLLNDAKARQTAVVTSSGTQRSTAKAAPTK